MSELLPAEGDVVSPESLLQTAELVFTKAKLPFVTLPTTYQIESGDLLSGRMGPSNLAMAIDSENKRAMDSELDRLNHQRMAWMHRSKAEVVANLLSRNRQTSPFGMEQYQPTMDIEASLLKSSRQLHFHLLLADAYPTLYVAVREWNLGGQVTVAKQDYELDPTANALVIEMQYPLRDGSDVDLFVNHSLYPNSDVVQTGARPANLSISRTSAADWKGVPYQPFADQPVDGSVLMKRAMEMFINGENVPY